MIPGSKLTNLKNLLQVPAGNGVKNSAPRVYFKLANKKKSKNNSSIILQDVDDFGSKLKIKSPLIPFGVVLAILQLRLGRVDDLDFGSGLFVMTLVPPGARSLKARVVILAIQKNNQSAAHDGNGIMTF